VVTGPSGSGKSSLAFDTIYAEGQRRYVESLSTYAKQFLERMEKPDVDRVEGISPAVAIEQRNPTKTSRSTVGTATEVYDYLRLLWARVGRTYCPGDGGEPCGREVRPDTVQSATDRGARAAGAGTRGSWSASRSRSPRGHARAGGGEPARARLPARARRRRGAAPGRAAGRAPTSPAPASCWWWWTGCAVDAGGARPRSPTRCRPRSPRGRGRRWWSRWRAGAPLHRALPLPGPPGDRVPTPTPQLFSFNNPYGSCPECTGFGAVLRYDPRR
jgi:excinuclease ABC subunit A